MNISLVGDELFYADRQAAKQINGWREERTERRDMSNCRFSVVFGRTYKSRFQASCTV